MKLITGSRICGEVVDRPGRKVQRQRFAARGRKVRKLLRGEFNAQIDVATRFGRDNRAVMRAEILDRFQADAAGIHRLAIRARQREMLRADTTRDGFARVKRARQAAVWHDPPMFAQQQRAIAIAARSDEVHGADEVGDEGVDRPVDPFVADFIGTMNLVTARSDGNGALLLGEHWRVVPNGGLPRALDAGEAVTCCIRPQHLTLSRTDSEAVNACRVSLEAVEYLGSHYRAVVTPEARGDVYLRIELTPEQLADLSPARGETLTLHLPPGSVHYFPANPAPGDELHQTGARAT